MNEDGEVVAKRKDGKDGPWNKLGDAPSNQVGHSINVCYIRQQSETFASTFDWFCTNLTDMARDQWRSVKRSRNRSGRQWSCWHLAMLLEAAMFHLT